MARTRTMEWGVSTLKNIAHKYPCINNIYFSCRFFYVFFFIYAFMLIYRLWDIELVTITMQKMFIFISLQSVIQMSGFRSLGDNEEVEFEYQTSDKGLEATRVTGPQRSDCHGSHRRPASKKRYRKIRSVSSQ